MSFVEQTIAYIMRFLSGMAEGNAVPVHYGSIETALDSAKIVIIPALANLEIKAVPKTPFAELDGTPVLFGEPRIERKGGRLVVYADIIASAFFLLSRYEEILKPECRDQHGRFRAKDSVVFQQGYGNRPLTDEYGVLLRKWLRELGADVPAEKQGFRKIYLTHDIDQPFFFERFYTVCKQWIKNLLRYHYSTTPLKKYLNEKYDEYYTFPKIIDYDKYLKQNLSTGGGYLKVFIL